MTEVGMALSCGLDFADRVDGSVGWPLPSVEVRLFDTDANEVIQPGHELDSKGRTREGEIQLRGPTVFREYWANETATRETFVESDDGKGSWFKTGDVATREPMENAGKGTSGEWAQGPMYFIQGRRSVDIIKIGGEKVSALEVERELLSLYVLLVPLLFVHFLTNQSPNRRSSRRWSPVRTMGPEGRSHSGSQLGCRHEGRTQWETLGTAGYATGIERPAGELQVAFRDEDS